MSSKGGPLDSGGQDRGDPAGAPGGLTPERLTELRCWIERREYMDPQTERLIATRILEQGDLRHR